MRHKDQVQLVNEEKLYMLFKNDNTPKWVQDQFLNLLSANGKIQYYYCIRSFINYCIDDECLKIDNISRVKPTDLSSITNLNILGYINTMKRGGIKLATIEDKMKKLNSFFIYCGKSGLIDRDLNPVKDVPKMHYKSRSKIKNHLKLPLQEDINKMFVNFSKGSEFNCVRNTCLANFILGSGLRESEVAALNVKDVSLSDVPCVHVLRKGRYADGEEEEVYLTSTAKESLLEWLKYRNENGLGNIECLFMNKFKNRLKERAIYDIINTYSNNTITPHMLRHYYGTTLFRETGNDLSFVQQQLGHSDPKTTMMYVDTTNKSVDKLKSM